MWYAFYVPKRPKKVPFQLHLTPEQDVRIELLSQRTFASKSKIIRDAIDEYLKTHNVIIPPPIQLSGQLRLADGGSSKDRHPSTDRADT